MGKISIIIPSGVTNLHTCPSVEYNTTGFVALSSTIQRSVAQQKYGVSSLEIVTANAADNEGAYLDTNPNAANTAYTASAWVYGTSGTVRLRLDDRTNGTETAGTAVTLNSTWQRITVTHTTGGVACTNLWCIVETDTQQNITYYADAFQVEAGSTATTYADGSLWGCEWNGAVHNSTSTRSAQSRAGGTIVDITDTYSIVVDQIFGAGMPAFRHNVRGLSLQPGAQLQSIKEEPRVLQLTCYTNTSSESTLYTARDYLIDALKPDLVATLQPVTLRYTGTGTDVDCYCFYDAGLEGSFDCTNYEQFTLRLICYDPFWYEVGNEGQALLTGKTLGNLYMLGKEDGSWSALGTPASSATITAIRIAPSDHDNLLYVGGSFTNLDGIGAADYIATWDGTSWAAVAAGGTGPPWDITFAPDGTLYVGGNFLNWNGMAAGDNIVSWNGTTWSVLSTGANSLVHDILVARDGTVYACGLFTSIGGVATRGIGQWDGTNWAAVGAGVDDNGCHALAEDSQGNIYVCGNFTAIGADADLSRIAMWDGAAWNALDTGIDNNWVYDIAIADNDAIYAVGSFTTVSGATMTRAAKWDGNAWSPLSTGLNADAYDAIVAPNGDLYVVGDFTTAGGITVTRGTVRWNGYTWLNVPWEPVGFSPVPRTVDVGYQDPVVKQNFNMYFGTTSATNSLRASANTTVTNNGSRIAYPTLTIYNSGTTTWPTLQSIRNETTGEELNFDLEIMGGEEITISLFTSNDPSREKAKTMESNFSGNIISKLLPASDFAAFALQPGDNDISVYISGTPEETDDDANQLSDWQYIDGITSGNTDRGILYVTVVDEGAGNYHVNLYKDVARTALVGHTASYAASGDEDIIEDNSSGLGGHIAVTVPGMADAGIQVYYTICDMTWVATHWGVSGSA